MRSPVASAGSTRLLLLRAARLGQQRGGHDGARHERAGQARVAHLLDEQGHVEQRAAAAAELRRHEQPGPAELGHPRHSASSKPRASSTHSCTRSGGQCSFRNARAVEVSICCEGEGRMSIAQPRLRASAFGSAGKPSPRTAMVVRSTSAVPPAIVWPRLVR